MTPIGADLGGGLVKVTSILMEGAGRPKENDATNGFR